MRNMIIVFLLCLFVALVLMPCGYSYWHQGVEIKGKIRTGHWKKPAVETPSMETGVAVQPTELQQK